jgi:hypothetical protein
MAFAPDGRLFVTERPGRCGLEPATGTSELALTLRTRSLKEAGALGVASIRTSLSRLVYLLHGAVGAARSIGSCATAK